ncbi:MAG: hypothetical protein ACE5WD_10415 [Candidatus Aminicenantia bacterium]
MTKESTEERNKSYEKEKQRQGKFDEITSQVEKMAVKTAESIKKVIEKALSARNTVLTIRVNDESNKKLNMLVEAGIFKSRSESAAFLIQEGIKSQQKLFDKIENKLSEIEKLKSELKDTWAKEIKISD